MIKSFLNEELLKEMDQDPYKGYYGIISEIVEERLDIKNENLKSLFQTIYTDSFYSLLWKYKDDLIAMTEIMEKIDNIKKIEATNSKEAHYSGKTTAIIEDEDSTKQEELDNRLNITINLFYLLEESEKIKDIDTIDVEKINIKELIKVINHENEHAISMDENIIGLRNVFKFACLNEVYTVFLENEDTSKFFDENFQSPKRFIFDETNKGFNSINSLSGYEMVSMYGYALDALEGEKLRYFYTKIPNRNQKSNNLEEELKEYYNEFTRTYQNLENILEAGKGNAPLDLKSFYASANREILKIAKDKIDNGMSIDEYFRMSSALKKIPIKYDGVNVFEESIKVMDLYYFYKGVFNEKNKDFLPILKGENHFIVFSLNEENNIVANEFNWKGSKFQEIFKHTNDEPFSSFLEKVDIVRKGSLENPSIGRDLTLKDVKIANELFSGKTKELDTPLNYKQMQKCLMLQVPNDVIFEEQNKISCIIKEEDEIKEDNYINNYLIFSDGVTKEEKNLKRWFFIKDNQSMIEREIGTSYIRYKAMEKEVIIEENIEMDDDILTKIMKNCPDEEVFKEVLSTIKQKDEKFFYALVNANEGLLLKEAHNQRMYKHMAIIIDMIDFKDINYGFDIRLDEMSSFIDKEMTLSSKDTTSWLNYIEDIKLSSQDESIERGISPAIFTEIAHIGYERNVNIQRSVSEIARLGNILTLEKKSITSINTIRDEENRSVVDALLENNTISSYLVLDGLVKTNIVDLELDSKQKGILATNLVIQNMDSINEVAKNYGEESINIYKIIDTFIEKDSILDISTFLFNGGLKFPISQSKYSDIVAFCLRNRDEEDNLIDLLIDETMNTIYEDKTPGIYTNVLCDRLLRNEMADKIFDNDLIIHLKPEDKLKIVRNSLDEYICGKWIEEKDIRFRESILEFALRNRQNTNEDSDICNAILKFAIEERDFNRFAPLIDENYKLNDDMKEFLHTEIPYISESDFKEIYNIFKQNGKVENLIDIRNIALSIDTSFSNEYIEEVFKKEDFENIKVEKNSIDAIKFEEINTNPLSQISHEVFEISI